MNHGTNSHTDDMTTKNQLVVHYISSDRYSMVFHQLLLQFFFSLCFCRIGLMTSYSSWMTLVLLSSQNELTFQTTFSYMAMWLTPPPIHLCEYVVEVTSVLVVVKARQELLWLFQGSQAAASETETVSTIPLLSAKAHPTHNQMDNN